jgi:hypothetical protein
MLKFTLILYISFLIFWFLLLGESEKKPACVASGGTKQDSIHTPYFRSNSSSFEKVIKVSSNCPHLQRSISQYQNQTGPIMTKR